MGAGREKKGYVVDSGVGCRAVVTVVSIASVAGARSLGFPENSSRFDEAGAV